MRESRSRPQSPRSESIVMLAYGIILILLTLIQSSGAASNAEIFITRKLNPLSSSPVSLALAIALSNLGSPFFWIITAGLVVMDAVARRRVTLLLELALSLLLATVMNQAIKDFVMRPRPSEVLTDVLATSEAATDYSYPSGHSSRAAAGCAILRNWAGGRYGIVATIVPPLVAVSRIILGVHFLLDVVAGIFLGLLAAHLSPVLTSLLLDRLQIIGGYRSERARDGSLQP